MINYAADIENHVQMRQNHNLNLIQTSFKKKIKECLNSVSIKFNSISSNLFDVTKKEISFKNELKKNLKILENSSSEEKFGPETPINESRNINFPVFENEFNGKQEDNLFNSNLMSGLNLLTEKVINHESDFNDNNDISTLISKTNTLQEMDNMNYIDVSCSNNTNWNKNSYSNNGIPLDDEFNKTNVFRCKSNQKFRKSIEHLHFKESKYILISVKLIRYKFQNWTN